MTQTTLADRGRAGLHADRTPTSTLRQTATLALSKAADGLADPKLVLSWLLTHLGAGAGWAGLLVPVREEGALLPQLVAAGRIRALPRRRAAWAVGLAGQGAAAAGITLVALTLGGVAAGAATVALVAVLALSRATASVASKDVLGRTLPKGTRGTVTGRASAIGATAVLAFAVLLLTDAVPRYPVVAGALALAAAAWLLAAALAATVAEPADPDRRRDTAQSLAQLRRLVDTPELARFVLVRALLVGSALAPPYLVLLGSGAAPFAQIGALVIASSAAAMLSAWLWGAAADRSARRVLILSGLGTAAALGFALGAHALGASDGVWAMPAALFALMIAYHGVRRGRSTYLIDMAPDSERATYTAVANTVIGIALLLVGGGTAALATVSVPLVLGLFVVMSLAGAAVAAGGLREHGPDHDS